ncbi:MAG TPA: hypothetical protein VMZ91_03475 [Candidatus Paceibacterota bacterium]|nr:hypothetical protein [Candidatus Paceibacterota bacterium]
MNIKGEKNILEIKQRELRDELNKSPENQNRRKIERLEDSIERHKQIAKKIKYHRTKKGIAQKRRGKRYKINMMKGYKNDRV